MSIVDQFECAQKGHRWCYSCNDIACDVVFCRVCLSPKRASDAYDGSPLSLPWALDQPCLCSERRSASEPEPSDGWPDARSRI